MSHLTPRRPADETALPRLDFHPYRWGDPAHAVTLSERLIGALGLVGISVRETPPTPVGELRLPPSRLSDSFRSALVELIGAEHVSTAHDDRVAHAVGWSTPDLLRLRRDALADAPDVVLRPADHEQVVALLTWCSEQRVAVVPYGGGTSVVGGLAAQRDSFEALASLDLGRLDRLVDLDATSRVATLEAGLRAPRAEELVAAHGFTIGHFPQSYAGASIGGFAAARSAGQSSAGYGRFDDMVVGLTVATPRGTIEVGHAPRSAAGPDWRQILLGSEGAFGVITRVRLRVRPLPTIRVFEGWRFPDFASGAEALRRLAQDGPLPTVLRLSDELETLVNLADPNESLAESPGGCLAITGYEGDADDVARRREAATAVLRDAGGALLGEEPGEAWRAGRFNAPYLRDPLLEHGVLIETLETATFWSSLLEVRQAVSDALTTALAEQGTPGIAMCHISHVYETGASLYFTVAAQQAEDPLSQWATAKRAANAAIGRLGAAPSHHHGVGVDHRELYTEQLGPVATEALQSLKASLDPVGILNPGVLLPRREQ
ncbi:FAD-binding oxidoreductase [Aeromicrobium camelliae]|uniref:FAD-binding oxidoreductase n=1 Tax=Aeromicrobium camelliae TaxID=1538144 RepID=A0A3N6ZRX3_9ACTN|nr:FAD-binding oxidoreductase [Aeromicrobium camelliae]RQN09747.1 FAD-binding oxidoreductase [Aeromicrobium camelliae]